MIAKKKMGRALGWMVALLAATPAAAEWTMQPLQFSESPNSTPGATGSTGGGSMREPSYTNDRDDAEASGGKPACEFATNTTADTFQKRLECGAELGNDDFGVGYDLYAGISAWDRGANDKVRVDGGFHANATVFGSEHTIFGADAFMESTQAGAIYGRVDVIVLDHVVDYASRELGGNPSMDWPLEREFFSVGSTIPIAGGLFTVALRAGATGQIGVHINGSVSTTIDAQVKPSVGLTAFASAAAGILGGAVAEVGIDIHLLLLGIDLPLDLRVDALTFNGDARTWSVDASLQLESLSGWLEVWVTALFDLVEYRKVVASWDGLTKTYTLASKSGNLGI